MNKNASEPVGYKVGDFYYSALEYSFTGKIAFKGWKGYGGTNDNDPVSTAAGNPIQGFLIPTYASEWDPSNANFTKHYYNDMDFCANYRTSLTCSKCNSSTEYNKTWPGIQMTPETNGWWKFILTGHSHPGESPHYVQ